MKKKAFAIACHPDDIDFMMSGTLIMLKEAGYEIHYMNVANGSCGTNQFDYETIVRMRRQEAIDAANVIGAVFHESLVNDLEVFYELSTLRRLTAVVREVAPDIILTHGSYDYMEDHINTGRLAVSAAFCRGMTNFFSEPEMAVTSQSVALYHSMPHSLSDQLRNPVRPGMYVDVSTTIEQKKQMLSCHRSQKEWLDESQGNDAYLIDMEERTRFFGTMSGRYEFAEGWIRHNHIGFCSPEYNPLADDLGDKAFVDEEFEKGCY